MWAGESPGGQKESPGRPNLTLASCSSKYKNSQKQPGAMESERIIKDIMYIHSLQGKLMKQVE